VLSGKTLVSWNVSCFTEGVTGTFEEVSQMFGTVVRLIHESADRLGVPRDSAAVAHAIETARLALAEGHDVEVAFDVARHDLVRATMPADVLVA
jgi:hypothetical protein